MGFSEDVRGNQNVQRTIVDRADKTVFHVNYSADSTNEEVSITVNGLSVSNLNRFGAWQVYSHDGLERQTSTVSRTGATKAIGSFTHFNGKGQVDWTEDAATNRTALVYDPNTGRQVAVSNALGQVTHSEYDIEGRVLGTWGATYPVFYAYDAQGRMTNMFTLRDPAVEALVTNHASFLANIASFDRTTWLYDETSGLLTNKVYADGKGTAYSYTQDGKIFTRTWARGVTTTYRYNESGAITNIDYSDSTPDVTFAYDRLGRQTNAVAAGVAAYGFDYDPITSAVTNETLSVDAMPAPRSIARSYDSLSRPAGFSLDNGQAVVYSFDSTGRLGSVAWSAGGNTSTARYSYVEQSGMIAGYDIEGAGGVFRTRKAFEPSRDLVTSVANLFVSGSSTSVVSSFDYLNDALGRRVRRNDAGTGLPAAHTNVFGYNVRSELVSAGMDTNSFGYVYDPIGNRTTATNNAETLTYLSNELNQYTNIADGVTDKPTYDSDGNMLTYGGWTLGWDGENRLISASNGTTVLTFVFDHQSRRIAKIVGSATNVFLYDGWAMLSEVGRGVPAAPSYTNTFVYGPDLSGSFQGAGTIGGILLANFAGTKALFAFDANGNVTDLAATNGTLAAHYEFDPYGNTLIASGDLAVANPYRFSSKYTDDETGLVYYGFRSYWPEAGRWVSRDPVGEYGGDDPYVFVQNNPVGMTDLNGLWKVGVHKAKTKDWMIELLMPIIGAEPIAVADNDVDTVYNPASLPITEAKWSWHFNRNLIGTDSRIAHMNDCYTAATILCDWSLSNDAWEGAAGQLGFGLHALQDSVAHGDYNRKAEMPNPSAFFGSLASMLSLMHNFNAPGFGASNWPDSPDRDALMKTSWTTVAPDGIPTLTAMQAGTTVGTGTGVAGTAYWAMYQVVGSSGLRIQKTESLTKQRGQAFMTFVQEHSKKPCGECRRHFLPVP